jgi:DNA repair protein RadC
MGLFSTKRSNALPSLGASSRKSEAKAWRVTKRAQEDLLNRAGVPIYRIVLVKEGKLSTYESRIRSSANAFTVLQAFMEGSDREVFVVMCLDRKNGLIGLNLVSVGLLTGSLVHPREYFKPAILSNASSVILSHNHPSGDPLPSQEDRALTARLVQAGKLLGIEVLDHIIVGDGKYFSFADEGLLERG